MSNAVFPTSSFRGITFSSFKTPTWGSRMQRSVSGRELAAPDYANPIWNWKLTFSFLRDFPVGMIASELRLLQNFYNARQGSYDTFLYEDRDDYTVTDEPIGAGDGSATEFQLARRLYAGGFIEDITAPLAITEIAIDGTPTVDYTLDSSTGIVTFGSAPGDGLAITATFTYYFRCRFMDDAVEFERFLHQYWSVKELRLRSVVL